jgi:predicted tellurium resistance membrane protein TerC
MNDLLAARSQMAMSLAFHIVFAALGIALPLLMIVAYFYLFRIFKREVAFAVFLKSLINLLVRTGFKLGLSSRRTPECRAKLSASALFIGNCGSISFLQRRTAPKGETTISASALKYRTVKRFVDAIVGGQHRSADRWVS